MRWCVVAFTVLGFAASAAALVGTGGITVNGRLVEGWTGVWIVTAACAVAGVLFGMIWLLIFKTLALASRS